MSITVDALDNAKLAVYLMPDWQFYNTHYSIGYVGTSIAMHVKEDHIVHTVDELIRGLDKLDIQ